MAPSVGTTRFEFLAGGGEMGALMRSLDWSKTPLGPVDGWPQSLRSAVSICLGSRFPILIWWGRDLVMLYNDAYRPILGATKHPSAMGQVGRECWPEIWHIIGPMLEDTVLGRGEATWSDDQLLVLDRNGYLEECYFTFSYSPIRDETGGIGGVFCAVTETTGRVLGERRLRLLRLLATTAVDARDAAEACRRAAAALETAGADVPFALLYLLDRDGRTARLTGAAGLTAGTPASPREIDLTETGTPWPLGEVGQAGTARLATGLRTSHPELPGGPWSASPDAALVVPIGVAGQDRPAGFMVAGISPRRELDADYHDFVLLAADHIGMAIADAEALEAERRRAEALAELDRAKTTFFSNVSHEFRTPLTLMLAPLTDALEDVAQPLAPVHRERIQTAHRNSIRLLKLVNTLLDFSRIESGRVEAAYEPTDLSALTADLASGFRSACERAGLRLTVDCEPLPGPIHVDRDMWEKIVLNLVSNAFKFTLHGEIEVTLRGVPSGVQLTVRDTGAGIPEDELPQLFERFHRVRGTRGRTQEGTGIGLALVRELVRLHGGTVAAESRVGVGSRFVVSIPAGTGHLPADRVGGARSLASTTLGASAYVEEALRWLPDADPALPGSASMDMLDAATVVGRSEALVPGSGAAGPRAPRARILWVDDNADMRDYVRRLLGRHYDVEAVADGSTALAVARQGPPDLVLTDVMLPGLDGFALLRALRADERLRTVPVIMLSARAGEEARVEGLRAGADDYLVKPFSARELLARVEAHLKLERVRRESQAALLASEAKFATAFDESPLVLTITSLDTGRLVEVNEAFVRLSGYTRAETLGRTPDELSLWGDATLRAERFAQLRVGQRVPTIEARFRIKSGEMLTGLISSAVVEIDGRPCVLSSITDITERKRAEEALQAADRAKDEFLAMLGHELRNPLGALASAARLLDLEGRTPEIAARAHGVIARQLDLLTRLVDDLLDVSRVTSAKVRLSRRPLDLAHAARGAVDTLRARGAMERHQLTFEGQPAWVDADETRIEQIVTNLVGNAMKFTPPGGTITVTVERDGLDAVLAVRDTGIGIAAETLPRIFDLFVQGERSLDRPQGGLGIGLTLVRRLVELHGGTVQASSEGRGKGSLFTVRLPAIHAPAAGATPHPDALTASRPCRVLVVEDNDDAREMLRMLLTRQGHEVHEAADGPSGLEAALTLEPDIALLDVGLPGLDGYAVARGIRARPEGQRIVLVALTGYGQPEDRRRAEEAGFDAHVVKPVDLAQLAPWLARAGRADAGHPGTDRLHETD